MRKLASQVPESVSRLLRSTLLQSPPTWYLPVLSNPPPIHPARSTTQRHKRLPNGSQIPLYNDVRPHTLDISGEGRTRTHQMKHLREKKPRVEEVIYEEDRIRRRFFADFPFEALRPVSLVEGREIRGEEEEGVSGKNWTKLSQRGSYPTVENTIAFTLNLHHTFKRPISESYETAVSEFSQLRGLHELSTLAAESEARAHGAVFKLDPFERVHAKEEAALSTLATYNTSSSSSTSAPSTKYKKPARWSSALPSTSMPSTEFSAGRQYVEQWKMPAPLQVDQPQEAASSGNSSADVQGESYGGEVEEMDDDAFIRKELEMTTRSRA